MLSVTQIHAGSADNVIPDKAYINGTVRTFDPAVQDMVERRMSAIVAGKDMRLEKQWIKRLRSKFFWRYF